MAFGTGVLIATLTFSILVDAFSVTHALPATAVGFILGGVSFTIANYILERKSKSRASDAIDVGRSPDENAAAEKPASGQSLFIGSLMDNIPENAALGITLATGGAINIARLVAIFVSNFPEGLASTNDMKSSGLSSKYVLVLWSIGVGVAAVATTMGYGILSNASPPIISISIAFAAGAIIVMLAESMIPEAFERGGVRKGLALLGGFLIAAFLTMVQGE
jgi:zinc transporter, ZIP family